MNDVTQCSQFIAISFKVYDIVRSEKFFILFSFFFVNLLLIQCNSSL